jgi:hypothetical protein
MQQWTHLRPHVQITQCTVTVHGMHLAKFDNHPARLSWIRMSCTLYSKTNGINVTSKRTSHHVYDQACAACAYIHSMQLTHPPETPRAPVLQVHRYGRVVNAAILDLIERKHLQEAARKHATFSRFLDERISEVKGLPGQLARRQGQGAGAPADPVVVLRPVHAAVRAILRALEQFETLAASYEKYVPRCSGLVLLWQRDKVWCCEGPAAGVLCRGGECCCCSY